MPSIQLDPEMQALQEVGGALTKLGDDKEAVERVIRWAAAKHGVELHGTKPPNETAALSLGDADSSTGVADLYAAAAPTTDPEKALVVAHWLQIRGGGEDLPANSISKELRNLGHGVSNITDALDSLIRRKPQLVIQTRKEGTSRQARKKYKVTKAGADFVAGMVKKGQIPES